MNTLESGSFLETFFSSYFGAFGLRSEELKATGTFNPLPPIFSKGETYAFSGGIGGGTATESTFSTSPGSASTANVTN